jgi:hypothetical protein
MWFGMPGKNLKLIFKVKAKRARELSNLWRGALNDWLEVSEHDKDLGKIKLLGRREWIARKKANKATEEMYTAWKKWKGI